MDRSYAFLAEQGVSLVMESEPLNGEDAEGWSKIRLAMAFCRPGDDFNRKLARKILDGRLESQKFDRFYCESSIRSEKPRSEFFTPLIRKLRREIARSVVFTDRDGQRFEGLLTQPSGAGPHGGDMVIRIGRNRFTIGEDEMLEQTTISAHRNVDRVFADIKKSTYCSLSENLAEALV